MEKYGPFHHHFPGMIWSILSI